MVQNGILISGISGRFPESDSLPEFVKKLYSGQDLVTTDARRFPPGYLGTPERSGKLNTINKFDADFFNISPKQAHVTDPALRILLEVTYEAMFDAGVNPAEMRGSRTGVFVGLSTSASESEEFWLREPEKIDGLSGIGCCRAMFANRISYTFDFKGPSMPVDTTCASGLMCLDLAVSHIISGRCDSAIVAGTSVILKPEGTLKLLKLGVISPDGACKAFDQRANGYARSEAVVALFLQRADVARRSYAIIRGILSKNDGYKELGMLGPSAADQIRLLEEVYAEAGVDPTKVDYVEAHGSGTQRGDTLELGAISTVLCKGRKGPLRVGALKTNMGHSEPASGLANIFKVLTAAQKNLIPANLHFVTPNPNIPCLFDGRVQIVTQNTPFNAKLVGVSGFGIGGNNVHAILEMSAPKAEVEAEFALLPFSGRTRAAVETAVQDLVDRPVGTQEAALIQRFFSQDVPKHSYRGFALRNGDKSEVEVEEVPSERRPICFVFTGMGSQWPGMGVALMRFPAFKASIQCSAEILKVHGVDLLDLLLSPSPTAFDNVLNCFVSIVAVQVGLVDLLHAIGIRADIMLGHSVGELACAYADGCFTSEETILAALARGHAIQEANLEPGSMAALGLNWAEAKARCPADVFPACHNAVDNVTVSGPPASIDKFVAELKSQGIFARGVESCGVAFHSKYVAAAEARLKTGLEAVIGKPKERSKRWVSTSVPEGEWETELGRYSSVAYHANNLTSPVFLYEALKHVPGQALVIEVGPHALLQAILKRSLPASCTLFQLCNRNAPDNAVTFLRAVGQLYMNGVTPDVHELFPPTSFPVGLNTPMTNRLIGWNHEDTWDVANFVGTTESINEADAALGAAVRNALLAHPALAALILPSKHGLNDVVVELKSPFENAVKNGSCNGNGHSKDVHEGSLKSSADEQAPVEIVAKKLGLKRVTKSNLVCTLSELGMDSMLGAELRTRLEAQFRLNLSMERLLQMRLNEFVGLSQPC